MVGILATIGTFEKFFVWCTANAGWLGHCDIGTVATFELYSYHGEYCLVGLGHWDSGHFVYFSGFSCECWSVGWNGGTVGTWEIILIP